MLGSIDHIVLTTADLDRCLDFYTRVLGTSIERYGAGRIALRFGAHKFNVHPPGFSAHQSEGADAGLPRSMLSR